MKRIYRILLAVVLLVSSVTTHAKQCFDFFPAFCEYIDNGGFGSGYSGWDSYSGTTIDNPTRCGYSTNLLQMPYGSFIEQTFYVDDEFTQFDIGFFAYLQNDTNNYYDELTITVTNTTSNQSEMFRLRGSTYNTTCARQGRTLQNDYSNSWVTVTFEVGSLTSGLWEIDDVSFSAIY